MFLRKVLLDYNEQRQLHTRQKSPVPTAMGSPVSAVVANLVMEELEQSIFESHENWLPWYWYRFVDDTFVIVHTTVVDQLLGQLGRVFPSINFTIEIEKESKLAFLDVEVHS